MRTLQAVAYKRFGNYVSVPAEATYRLSVTPATNTSTVLARYDVGLGFWKGRSAVVIATGFLATGSTTPFQPWVVLLNDGTFPLNAVTNFGADNPQQLAARGKAQSVEVALSPNLASNLVTTNINLTKDADVNIQIVDVAGRTVQRA